MLSADVSWVPAMRNVARVRNVSSEVERACELGQVNCLAKNPTGFGNVSFHMFLARLWVEGPRIDPNRLLSQGADAQLLARYGQCLLLGD